MGFFSIETAERTLQGYEVMNMMRKGQMRGVEKGDIMARSRSSPVCLEWPPKLNKQRVLVPLAGLQEFLQHSQHQ